jgi:hypothetical protein
VGAPLRHGRQVLDEEERQRMQVNMAQVMSFTVTEFPILLMKC